MKYLELFAGIGGFRKALDLISKDFNIPFAPVGFSEIDIYATKSYKANFDTSSELEMGDIVKSTSNKKNIQKIADVDLIMGGFPCQSFSMMGKQKGFCDIRGSLFFKIIEIAKIKKPKYILLENVKNLMTHDKGNTLKSILESLKNAGYGNIYYDIFNTEDFELAHRRNRLYIFAIRNDLCSDFNFSKNAVLENFKKIKRKTSILRQSTVLDVLDKDVNAKYYLSEKIKPTILSNGSGNFRSKSVINQLIARPLTASMVKMHRACQDNYYSDEFLKNKNPLGFLKKDFSKDELQKHSIRKLTPREALALQGFDDEFYNNCVNAGLSDHQLYKQAGNAVSVNVVYAILHHIFVKNKDNV